MKLSFESINYSVIYSFVKVFNYNCFIDINNFHKFINYLSE